MSYDRGAGHIAQVLAVVENSGLKRGNNITWQPCSGAAGNLHLGTAGGLKVEASMKRVSAATSQNPSLSRVEKCGDSHDGRATPPWCGPDHHSANSGLPPGRGTAVF